MFVLKLPLFFTQLYGEEKRAAISKLTYIGTPSSCSYIVFALMCTQSVKFYSLYRAETNGRLSRDTTQIPVTFTEIFNNLKIEGRPYKIEDFENLEIQFQRNCKPEQNKTLWKPGSCFSPNSYNTKRDKKTAGNGNCPETCAVDKIQIVETYEEYQCFSESGETQKRGKREARVTGTVTCKNMNLAVY